MAAVEFAWESQSMRRVGCSAAARQAAKFTAVVVFPTPPFWLATAIIRAKRILASENLAKASSRCKMFHVEHRFWVQIVPGRTDCSTWNALSLLGNAGGLARKRMRRVRLARSGRRFGDVPRET